VIRRILEHLEADRRREIQAGLDATGRVGWRQSAGELLEQTGGWQARLRALGVGAGDRVALDLPRGPHLVPAHLAALAGGATLVPLNPSLSAEERARVLERAEVRALLGPDERPAAPAPPELAARDPEVPALLIFTSGTTGEPKGVPLREANLEANLAALEAAWGMRPSDRLLHALPAHHVHGLALALYGSLRAGAAVVMMSRFDAQLCLRSLESQRISLFMGVPTMYHRMIRCPVEVDLSALRLFVSGSAPLPPSDFRDCAERFGHEPLERYGLTETMIVASNPLDGERRPGTVGHALADTEVRLAPDGEIEVSGPAVMAGYWRAPEATCDAFREGFFRTGDLGRLDERGYLVIAGRKKELIIVGGSNVLPGEVERALEGEPDVEELAVAGLRDPDRGEIVAAFVVPAAVADPRAIERRLRERAEAALAPYKRPRSYRFLAGLPRNPMGKMGKIDRRALSESA
jgi:malonyl-CoA/methylmalonyl-CoA synthetase